MRIFEPEAGQQDKDSPGSLSDFWRPKGAEKSATPPVVCAGRKRKIHGIWGLEATCACHRPSGLSP